MKSPFTFKISIGFKILLFTLFLTFTANAQLGFMASWVGRPLMWMWVSGVQTGDPAGVWGTKGVPSASNVPPGHSDGCLVSDSSGSIWLFAGYSSGLFGGVVYMNDLWRYNPSTLEWTWVAGSSSSGATAVHGTKGIPSTNNIPGARAGHICWIDSSNQIWVFGGFGGANPDYYNDLWRFNPSTLEWTWMSGSKTANSSGSYGTKGVSSPTNVPMSRTRSGGFLDLSGNFWIFGGYDFGGSRRNDLWKYDPSINEWVWISGSNSGNSTGTYGIKGVPSVNNIPPARTIANSTVVDGNGQFWLFGGYNGTASWNDLWKYNPGSNEWTWMSGSSQTGEAGHYGTKGVFDPSNVPGARRLNSLFADSAGNVFFFGGVSGGTWNDFWQYSSTYNQWAWLTGSNSAGASSVYGTKGKAAPANTIGARDGALFTRDRFGNLWIFGGVDSSSSFHNDLWRTSRY